MKPYVHLSVIASVLFVLYLFFISLPEEKKEETILYKVKLNNEFYLKVDERMVQVDEKEYYTYQLGAIYTER